HVLCSIVAVLGGAKKHSMTRRCGMEPSRTNAPSDLFMSADLLINSSRLSAMRLPVELLSEIFDIACYIDPSIPSTLCIVSSACHEIALPLLHRTLFIHGPDHLRCVVRHLEAHPDRLRLVQHVFLTDHLQ